MRLRGIVVLALSTTACAAVIGLGDYEVGSDADAGLGNETGVSSSSGVVPTKEGGGADAFVDAESDGESPQDDAGAAPDGDAAISDAGKAPDADAAPLDAGSDASVNRTGIACSNAAEICSGSPPCCHQGSGAFSCLGSATCQGPANGDVFDCDDANDCKKGGESACCVELGADGKPKRSYCSSTCSGSSSRACTSNADCQSVSGLTCQAPKAPYTTALPLLKVCR